MDSIVRNNENETATSCDIQLCQDLLINNLIKEMLQQKIINFATYKKAIKKVEVYDGGEKSMQRDDYYNGTYYDKHDARNHITVNRRSKKRRTAIDARVSTKHEQQVHALDNQIDWCIALAKQYQDEWIFDKDTDLYIEDGIFGTSLKNRPTFQSMINKAFNGEYELIVVREVCRFMRNARLTLD